MKSWRRLRGAMKRLYSRAISVLLIPRQPGYRVSATRCAAGTTPEEHAGMIPGVIEVLKRLERENQWLRKVVAGQRLEFEILKEAMRLTRASSPPYNQAARADSQHKHHHRQEDAPVSRGRGGR